MIPDDTLQIFFEEATELLATAEAALLHLEQAPGDRETLDRLFRAVHTLKGTSGMMGFEDIARFAHALEDLLIRIRKGERTATSAVIDVLLRSADVLRRLVEQARGGGAVEGLETALAAIETQARQGDPTPPSESRPTETASGGAVYTVRFTPPADLLRRGLDPLRLLEALEALGEVVAFAPDTTTLPPLGALDPESAYLGFTCRLRTTAPRSEIQAVFAFVDEPGCLTIDDDAKPAPPADGADDPERWRETDTGTIRVATTKVDRLVDLIGELVVAQSIVTQMVTRFAPERLGALRDAAAQMDRHVRDLQERVLAVRMLPIRSAFRRFQRVVRDLAHESGKDVALQVCGEETELDKKVIEQIVDPLTHLVRNAVDHGLETPEERRRLGKPATGRVTLTAQQQSGNIVIEVSDDGRGLDGDRILGKARELGLVAPDETPAERDLYALIFRAGFSTAARVTQVSGRGVGMDVVARNVEMLGGSITIQSEPGRGATFRIRLPLTLAILEGQTVRVGSEVYILPLVSIVESVRPRRSELNTLLNGLETFTLRQQVVPILRLGSLFGVESAASDPTEGLLAIVEHEDRKVALFVDELLAQQQVVIKSLEANFQKRDGVAGASILGDGRVALVLDVPGLVAVSRAAGNAAARRRRAPDIPDDTGASGLPSTPGTSR